MLARHAPPSMSRPRLCLLALMMAPAACAPEPVAPGDAAADRAIVDTGPPSDLPPPLDAAPPDAAPQMDAAPRPDAVAPPDVAPSDAAPDARPDASPDTAPPPDATLPPDAAPDASPDVTPRCAVRVEPPEAVAGQVGASGGSPASDLVCPAGDEIIGVAVRVSDGDTANGSRSAVGLTVVCAAVTFGGGGPAVGAETPVEVMGNGMFGWTPATQSAVARCAPGWVVAGLRASRGPSNDQFLDVSVTCAELRADGTTTGVVRTIYAEGSLSAGPGYDTVVCPTGQVVRRLSTRAGAGFDSATVHCATPSCDP